MTPTRLLVIPISRGQGQSRRQCLVGFPLLCLHMTRWPMRMGTMRFRYKGGVVQASFQPHSPISLSSWENKRQFQVGLVLLFCPRIPCLRFIPLPQEFRSREKKSLIIRFHDSLVPLFPSFLLGIQGLVALCDWHLCASADNPIPESENVSSLPPWCPVQKNKYGMSEQPSDAHLI